MEGAFMCGSSSHVEGAFMCGSYSHGKGALHVGRATKVKFFTL